MITQSQEEWKKVLHLTSELEKELVGLRLEKNRIKVIIKDLYQNMVKGTAEKYFEFNAIYKRFALK